MTKRRILPASAMLLAAASLIAQAWRAGGGRLEGSVTNAQGEPIAGATVSPRWEDGQGPDLKTDKKGHWAVLGISGGSWNIDISAPGYQSRKLSAAVSEIQRSGPMNVQLQAEVSSEAAAPTLSVGGKKISKEAAEAIEKGNSAMKEAERARQSEEECRSSPAPGQESAEAKEKCAKTAAELLSRKLKDAQQSFLKALPELPDNLTLLTNLKLAFYMDKNTDEALKYARQIVAHDPGDSISWMMIAKLELERGNFEAGKEALSKAPEETLTDPMPYLNMGILYYNKGKTAEAEQFFTKAIAKKPDLADAYYYRGLARYQAKQIATAKADFQKYLELDPQGSDAPTARDILKTMK